MKKIISIALFVLGINFASNAEVTFRTEGPPQNTEVTVTGNDLKTSSSEMNGTESDLKAPEMDHHPAGGHGHKKWKDRTLGGKILICIGVGLFVILCVLYGTVTVG
jgi:hypothetical protein